jgi:hypothetical protein
MEINILRIRNGWLPENADYLGRKCYGFEGSPLANKRKVKHHTVEEHNKAVAVYKRWLRKAVVEKDRAVCDELTRLKAKLLAEGTLNLGCWCEPLPCHVEVVKAYLLRAIEVGYEF